MGYLCICNANFFVHAVERLTVYYQIMSYLFTCIARGVLLLWLCLFMGYDEFKERKRVDMGFVFGFMRTIKGGWRTKRVSW